MKKIITVPDMMCSNCEKRLEGLATRISGIKNITATHKDHLMEVEFDETKLSFEQILTEVSAIGFHPELSQGE